MMPQNPQSSIITAGSYMSPVRTECNLQDVLHRTMPGTGLFHA
jgi:hypothetical protein